MEAPDCFEDFEAEEEEVEAGKRSKKARQVEDDGKRWEEESC